MLAYRAEVVAHGPERRRTIPIDDFFVDTFVTALAPDEMLDRDCASQHQPNGSGGAYLKLERKVGDYAIAGVAVQLVLDATGVTQAGIGLTNVGPKPIRARRAEGRCWRRRRTKSVLEAAAELAAAATDPADDLRGPADYKRAVLAR